MFQIISKWRAAGCTYLTKDHLKYSLSSKCWILIKPCLDCIMIFYIIWWNCCQLKDFVLEYHNIIYPTRTLTKISLYVWYNRSIYWFIYIISITLINNWKSRNFWVTIKSGIFCFIMIFHFLKPNPLNLNPSNLLVSQSISLLLIVNSIYLSCS